MDPYLMKFIKDTTPKMNYDVVNGLAVKHLPYAMKYIDSILRNVFNDILPGFKYVRMVRCSPEEELKKEQRRKNDKLVIDIARSDLYLVGLDFTYVDPTKIDPVTGLPDTREIQLPRRYLFLPFAGPAGSIMVAGSRFFISAVLSDIVISFEKESVFIRLLRDKFAVNRFNHTVYINKKIETVNVVWSEIYHLHKDKKKEKNTRAFCPLLLYLLCIHGLNKTMEIYGGTSVITGSSDDLSADAYPEDQWCVYSSSKTLKRRGIKKTGTYSDICIAVPKDKNTQHLQSLIGTVFYLLDYFPDVFADPSWLESKEKWMVVMGYIYFGEGEHVGILLEDIKEHFKSLDNYMDDIIKLKLQSIGIHVNDIYEFLGIIIERFGDWMIHTSENISSLYGKELSILYDTLFPITSSIFNCYFKLKSAAKSSQNVNKKLSVRDIEKIMDATIRARTIFGIIKPNGPTSSISYSGDNKFMKITSIITPQKRTTSSNDTGQLRDPEKRLHVSFVDVGNYSNLTGSTPVGNQRINPYVRLDENGNVLRSEESRQALDKTQEMIKRM